MEGSDLEDGELIESDSENCAKPVVQAAPSASSSWTAHRGAQQSADTFAHRAPKPQLLSSEDDDDSEEEYGSSPVKMFKQRRTQAPGGNTTDNHPFNNPLAMGASKGFDMKLWGPMVEESKAKKRNNIWSNVIQDQTLSATIGSVQVDRGDICVERDVESYDIHTKYLHTLINEEDSNDSNSRATDGSERDCEEDMKEDKGGENMFGDANAGEDLCEKESFAAAGLPKPKKKGIKSRLGRRVEDDESSRSSFGNSRPNTPCEPIDGTGALCDIESFGNEAANKIRKTIKERLGSKNSMDVDSSDQPRERRKRNHKQTKGPAKNRLGKRSYDKQKLRSHIKISVEDPPEAIVQGIMDTLSEPEHMRDTFERVVDILGGQKGLELLYMTEDVEEAGGMMTLRGDRRRTPGGVYLQLLKEDSSVSPDMHGQIFVEQRQRHKKEKKDRQRRHRERVKHERDARLKDLGQHPDTDLPNLPHKRDAMEPDLGSRPLVAHDDGLFDDNETDGIMLEAV